MHVFTVLVEEFYYDLSIPYCFIVHKYPLCLLPLEIDKWQVLRWRMTRAISSDLLKESIE